MMACKKIRIAAALLFVAAISAFSQFLYPSPLPKVETPWADFPYDSVLSKTWQGVKKRMVTPYSTGAVHRPKSNTPDDAVSEGISYGMFLALYANDQTYFNSMWDAGERYMWSTGGNCYDWRINNIGEKTGTGPASDADQDIALLLIFADQLVKEKIWAAGFKSMRGVTYEERVRSLLPTIRNDMTVEKNGHLYLLPGAWGAGGAGTINPGYFAPAFYRVFAEFEPEHAQTWNRIIDGSYDLIARSPGYSLGLLPDWCTYEGTSTGGAGYNAYFGGDALYRDAIRVYWRLATDYLWYQEPRAKIFLDKAITFMESKGGAGAANFFDIKGNLLPENDVEILSFGVGNIVVEDIRGIVRSRREHSHLTLGMWAAAAMGTGDVKLAKEYSDELLKFYVPNTDYWGRAVDPTGGRTIENAVAIHPTNQYAGPIEVGHITVPEDTLRNETYFDQFLAWFGASILSGNFMNVWQDLRDGLHIGPPTWIRQPSFTPADGDIDPSNASKGPLRITAELSRPVSWTVTLTHDTQNSSRTFSGNSDAIDITWTGLDASGNYMPQGFYLLNVRAAGLEYKNRVWLGRPYSNRPSLITGNRLLVDDFADGDIYPYIGNVWGVHTDADKDGGSSTASISVKPTGSGGANRLTWEYALNKSEWQFATLDWKIANSLDSQDPDTLDFRDGVVDTLIIVASSKNAGLDVSLQLISKDFGGHQYYEHWIKLSTTPQTFAIPLTAGVGGSFAQRMDGTGKDFQTTLSKMTAIRFHVQYDPGSDPTNTHYSGAINVERMLFAGRNVSRLYSYEPPPNYVAPPDGPITINVTHRGVSRQSVNYSVRRIGNRIVVSLPQNMAGADARIIDLRGKAVRRETVPPSARLDIRTDNLAAGMYFVEIRKKGTTALKLPIKNIR